MVTLRTAVAVATCTSAVALLISLVILRNVNPSSGFAIDGDDNIVRAGAFAFGTNLAMLCVCVVQAVFSRLQSKRSTARLLAMYFATMALTLGLLVSRATPSPRGMFGSVRVNITLHLAYIICLLGSELVSNPSDPARYEHPLSLRHWIAYVAVVTRELCTILARAFADPAVAVTFGTLACIIVTVMIVQAMHAMWIATMKSTPELRTTRTFFAGTTLILRFSEALSTVALIAYAQNIVSASNAETALCGTLQVRLLVVVIRHTCTELFVDETATRVAEERLAVQQTADAARRALYRTIFHELRVPLNSIVLGLQLLPTPAGTGGSDDDTDPATVQIMRDSADSMLSLLSDLLDTAKLEARGLTLTLAPVDLRELLHSTCRMMLPFAAGRSVHLTSTVSPSVPVGVLADRGRLRQLISNFASNAIKFCPHDGSGSVQLRVDIEDVSAAQPVVLNASPAASSMQSIQPLSPSSTSEVMHYAAASDGSHDRVMIVISCVDNGPGVPQPIAASCSNRLRSWLVLSLLLWIAAAAWVCRCARPLRSCTVAVSGCAMRPSVAAFFTLVCHSAASMRLLPSLVRVYHKFRPMHPIRVACQHRPPHGGCALPQHHLPQ